MDRDPAALSDMLISARLVRSYVEGINLSEFLPISGNGILPFRGAT